MEFRFARHRGQSGTRVFAISATIVLVLVAFAASSRPVSANSLTIASSGAVPAAVYEPGTATPMPDGSIRLQYMRTFQRWDGASRLEIALNRSTGE